MQRIVKRKWPEHLELLAEPGRSENPEAISEDAVVGFANQSKLWKRRGSRAVVIASRVLEVIAEDHRVDPDIDHRAAVDIHHCRRVIEDDARVIGEALVCAATRDRARRNAIELDA